MGKLLALLLLLPALCHAGRDAYVYQGDGYQLTPSYDSAYGHLDGSTENFLTIVADIGVTEIVDSLTCGANSGATWFTSCVAADGKLVVGNKGSGTYFIDYGILSEGGVILQGIFAIYKNDAYLGGLCGVTHEANYHRQFAGAGFFAYLEEDDYIQIGFMSPLLTTIYVFSVTFSMQRVQEDYIP